MIVPGSIAPVFIISGSHGLIGMEGFSTGAAVVWAKVYNASSAASVTCGAGTPAARYLIPGQANGNGYITMQSPSDIYTNGIVVCFTGGIADTDVTVPTASTFVVNFHWQ